jgi:hypothetical protein
MAYDAAFVARIRYVRDGMFNLLCDRVMLTSEMLDQAPRQFDFERQACPSKALAR